MAEIVEFAKDGRIAVITINNPPVNALSVAVVTGLRDAVRKGAADAGVDAMVITGAGRMFIAGADIREFGKPRPKDAPSLPEIIDEMEKSEKPLVAAINGVGAGGGLEVTLGCHFRVAAPTARLGVPEVKLGLLPGAGGTQRLPRLIGVEAALSLIAGGDLISAKAGLSLGIVDEVADDVVAAARAMAETAVADKVPLPRISQMQDKVEAARGKPEIFDNFRKAMARKARNMLAPYAIVECVEAAVDQPFEEGAKFERAEFMKLMTGEQSRAQRHVFFAEREVAKVPGIGKDTPIQPLDHVAIIGCGTMGGGIAMNFANAGIPVTVLEMSQEALDKGLGIIRKNYEGTLSRGRLTQEQLDTRVGLITGTTDFDDVKDADLVIEAVFEDMDVKKDVFTKLDRICKKDAILATNTSTLDVNEIAAVTGRPDKVIGMHFFSPANVMRLLENVRGAKSSDQTIATVMKLSRAIRKVGVLAGVCDGFIGNRMLAQYGREAGFLLEEGAVPRQVDKVIYDFGFPMGPFAMGDLAGLDIGWRIRQHRAATRPTNQRYSPIADRICEMGRFGQKTGAGWYRYEKGNRTPVPDPEIEKLIVDVSKELGIERRDISDQEILERCLYPLINEGAKILEEGIALRASDIDIVWIYGYGFPVYRGGPMFYADSVGLENVYDVMSRFYDQHGEAMKPAPLLEKLAKAGKGFHDA